MQIKVILGISPLFQNAKHIFFNSVNIRGHMRPQNVFPTNFKTKQVSFPIIKHLYLGFYN